MYFMGSLRCYCELLKREELKLLTARGGELLIS